MTTTAHQPATSVVETTFSDAERFALAGLLAGYRGLTRDAYASTCASTTWCQRHNLRLFEVRRAAGLGRPGWPAVAAPGSSRRW